MCWRIISKGEADLLEPYPDDGEGFSPVSFPRLIVIFFPVQLAGFGKISELSVSRGTFCGALVAIFFPTELDLGTPLGILKNCVTAWLPSKNQNSNFT